MTPKQKAEVVQLALLDAHRYGKPGDADALLSYLKDNPDAVEELAGDGVAAKAKSLSKGRWDESKHPRGQPENSGEFGPGEGAANAERDAYLKAAMRPAKKSDLKSDLIYLWHGTSLAAAKNILSHGLFGGDRGKNASADVLHASQYPEETGAECLVLIAADPKGLAVDPNDQIGETVEDGLFPKGHGSSTTVGKHNVVAIFDISDATNGDKAIAALKSGNIRAAEKLGVKVLLPPNSPNKT